MFDHPRVTFEGDGAPERNEPAIAIRISAPPRHGRHSSPLRSVPPVAALHRLLRDNELWLVRRTIEHHKKRNYLGFVSTLEEAWRAAVVGLIDALEAAEAKNGPVGPLLARLNYAEDPVAGYGIEVAERHRARGVDLALFLGSLKISRQAFLDLVAECDLPAAVRRGYRERVDNYFDRVEAGLCSRWASVDHETDIAALRERNRAVVNEKNKYLTIFESLKDPVVLLNEQGEIENFNAAAGALVGIPARPGAAYYGGPLPGEVRAALNHLLETRRPTSEDGRIECMLRTPAGLRCFEVRRQAMMDVSHKYSGEVVILSDVTDYKTACDRAEEASRAKSAFLATISHEIRTPINGILGLSRLMRDNLGEARGRHHVDAIATSAKTLLATVNDILDFTKIEAGTIEPDPVDFSPSALLAEALAPFEAPALGKGLSLSSSVAPEVPERVRGDVTKLRQVLINLISNAVKFTERGAVVIRLSGQDQGAHAFRLHMTVEDNGVGIPPEAMETIFDPFVQADASIARRFGGTGMGLAICRQLVAIMDGAVWAESRPDGGSIFHATAVVECASPQDDRGEAAPSGAPATDDASLSVLIVDDNDINLMVAEGFLTRFGHRATLARDGTEARQCLAVETFDAVLLDLRLPDVDGLTLLAELRERERREGLVPAVAVLCTAQRDEALVGASAALGASTLGKPFAPEELRAALRQAAPERTHDTGGAAGEGKETEPMVDMTLLGEHAAMLGAAPMLRVIEVFRVSVPPMVETIGREVAAGRLSEAGREAHRLKSACANLGLRRLASRAAAIEAACGSGAGSEARAQAEGLSALLSLSLDELSRCWAALAGN